MNPSAITLKNTSGLRIFLELVGALVIAIALMVVGDVLNDAGARRWVSTNAFDEAMRRLVLGSDRLAAASLSHKLSIGFLPLLAILGTAIPALFTTRRRAAIHNFTLVLVVFIVTTAIPAPVKAFFGRERPSFVHGLQSMTEAAQAPYEQFASFFSGDTAWAFAFAAVGATLAYLRGYRIAPALAAVGTAGAFAVAVLRMRADMHWATDVTMGAIIGTAVGVGVPLLLHPRVKNATRMKTVAAPAKAAPASEPKIALPQAA